MISFIKRIFKRKKNELILRFKNNKIELNDKNGNCLTIIRNENGYMINVLANIDFTISGNTQYTNLGKVDIVTTDIMNIDTWKSILNINSRKANQIKDEPEAIAFRKECKQIMTQYNNWKEKHKDEIVEAYDEYNEDELCDNCKAKLLEENK